MIPTVVCILTHNRQAMVRELAYRADMQLRPSDGPIIILDNASNPPVNLADFHPAIAQDNLFLHYIDRQPPNLAFNMNEGFKLAAQWAEGNAHPQWNVVMLCDDIQLPEEWIETVKTMLRKADAAACSTHTIRPAPQPILKTQPDADIINRMQGSAFILAGEKGLRADESMQWWWQDQDLDWQARLKGGMVLVPGPVATNQRPNDFTYNYPGMMEQAARDGEAFRAKWGWKPW